MAAVGRLSLRMKRLAAGTAVLLLSACQTMPYGQDPYGDPNPYPPVAYPPAGTYPTPGDLPPQGTYPAPVDVPPGAPYPGPGGYPPQGPYAGGPGQPAPPECPITASRDWQAWVNAMPGPNARPMLVVSGKVVTATGGYSVAFDRYLQVRRGQPAQAFVTLHVANPDMPAASQAQVTHEVRWDWPLSQPIGSVVIRCGDKTLAEITSIQTAY